MSAGFISTQGALDAVGWALVHFVWQGALVAVLFACFSALTRNATANVRYMGACVALALMLALPVATAALAASSARGLFAREEISSSEGMRTDSARERRRAERGIKSDAPPATQADELAPVSSTATLREWAAERLTALVPFFTFAWLAGVLLLASRLFGGWLLVLRLRRSAMPVATHLEAILARVSKRLRVA
ncbi:MAG: hypothetical protein H7Z38_24240, partial [Rubrivivax sp.]|nr:hypothetical protein [Pyrinomonadaceae bacterium]